jgi:hypothetical protein
MDASEEAGRGSGISQTHFRHVACLLCAPVLLLQHPVVPMAPNHAREAAALRVCGYHVDNALDVVPRVYWQPGLLWCSGLACGYKAPFVYVFYKRFPFVGPEPVLAIACTAAATHSLAFRQEPDIAFRQKQRVHT